MRATPEKTQTESPITKKSKTIPYSHLHYQNKFYLMHKTFLHNHSPHTSNLNQTTKMQNAIFYLEHVLNLTHEKVAGLQRGWNIGFVIIVEQYSFTLSLERVRPSLKKWRVAMDEENGPFKLLSLKVKEVSWSGPLNSYTFF